MKQNHHYTLVQQKTKNNFKRLITKVSWRFPQKKVTLRNMNVSNMLKNPQCGNLRIFLLIRFYVKSLLMICCKNFKSSSNPTFYSSNISCKIKLSEKFSYFHTVKSLWGCFLLIWWDLYCILLISSFVVSISSSESITGNGFSADSGIFSSIHFSGSSSSVFRAIKVKII